MRPIGYYVHHHGDGHRQRALALAATDSERFTLIGTRLAARTENVAALDLPDDRLADAGFDGLDNEDERPFAFHYAPRSHEGVRQRMSAIAHWIGLQRPSLMIVDVSVEVALLARLCSTPVAYVRLGGCRDDPPHLEAFRAASVLIAPFAAALDDPQMPNWVRRKTIFAPGLIRRRIAGCAEAGRVLVVVGQGGSSITAGEIVAAARATPGRTWRVIGLRPPDGPSAENIAFIEWTDRPEHEIACAEWVVGGAGDGLVGAVLAARRPFVCIPEARPFGEQAAKAEALRRAGAAIVRSKWPHDHEWPALLAAARACDRSAQAALDDPNGAENLMLALRGIVDCQK